MSGPLEGKVAIVTGSGRGIGRAVAEILAARGAAVLVNDLDAARAERTAAEIGGRAIAVPADVSKAAEVADLVGTAIARFGGVDILVNNAGMDRAAPIADITEEEWDRFMAVNLKSVFLCSKAVLPSMIERGGGRIVSLASIVARQGALNGGIHYATTKAGILGFTRTLARQIAKHGITVNAIAPGVVDTDLIRENVKPEMRERLIQAIPLGRLAETRDIAGTIAFLVSDEAAYLTGATLDVNGGLWMG
jgi:NAD(P)-dependent dehydrogenase (short-subunit alcohol dehydrogenase family)